MTPTKANSIIPAAWTPSLDREETIIPSAWTPSTIATRGRKRSKSNQRSRSQSKNRSRRTSECSDFLGFDNSSSAELVKIQALNSSKNKNNESNNNNNNKELDALKSSNDYKKYVSQTALVVKYRNKNITLPKVSINSELNHLFNALAEYRKICSYLRSKRTRDIRDIEAQFNVFTEKLPCILSTSIFKQNSATLTPIFEYYVTKIFQNSARYVCGKSITYESLCQAIRDVQYTLPTTFPLYANVTKLLNKLKKKDHTIEKHTFPGFPMTKLRVFAWYVGVSSVRDRHLVLNLLHDFARMCIEPMKSYVINNNLLNYFGQPEYAIVQTFLSQKNQNLKRCFKDSYESWVRVNLLKRIISLHKAIVELRKTNIAY